MMIQSNSEREVEWLAGCHLYGIQQTERYYCLFISLFILSS